MGRNSVKEDKNIYQLKREEMGFTREKASEIINVSADKIEKIENRGVVPYPEEVLAMADGFKKHSGQSENLKSKCKSFFIFRRITNNAPHKVNTME